MSEDGIKSGVTYSDELALRICARLAEGVPLTKICTEPNTPNVVTVYRWLREKPEFQAMYETARQDMAHTLADEILTIADDAPLVVEVDGETVTVKLDMAAVQRNRTRLDARKWIASKLFPRKFGERQELVGAGGAPLVPDLSKELTKEEHMEMARRVAFMLRKAADLNESEPTPSAPLRLAHLSAGDRIDLHGEPLVARRVDD